MESETEAVNTETLDLDRLPVSGIVQAMHRADQEAVEAVGAILPYIVAAVERITTALGSEGRLFYIGAGTSGRLGVLDASECPPTFGTPADLFQGVIAGGDRALRNAIEGAEDDYEAAARDLSERGFGPGDVLVGIAASGRTPYVLAAVAYARGLGALTIGLTSVLGSELANQVELALIPRTGPEILAGSTRLKAGTAAKLILNMLSTASLVKLGYVHGNLMVNVLPTNQKLKTRAINLIARIADTDTSTAARLLDEGRTVKVAVVMHRLGVNRKAAERRLAASGGRLRAALATSESGTEQVPETPDLLD